MIVSSNLYTYEEMSIDYDAMRKKKCYHALVDAEPTLTALSAR